MPLADDALSGVPPPDFPGASDVLLVRASVTVAGTEPGLTGAIGVPIRDPGVPDDAGRGSSGAGGAPPAVQFGATSTNCEPEEDMLKIVVTNQRCFYEFNVSTVWRFLSPPVAYFGKSIADLWNYHSSDCIVINLLQNSTIISRQTLLLNLCIDCDE